MRSTRPSSNATKASALSRPELINRMEWITAEAVLLAHGFTIEQLVVYAPASRLPLHNA